MPLYFSIRPKIKYIFLILCISGGISFPSLIFLDTNEGNSWKKIFFQEINVLVRYIEFDCL